MDMDKSYIAGFFDGEGSAMALTIRRNLPSGIIYRVRPVIKIAQGTKPVLQEIKEFLGFGTVVIASTFSKEAGRNEINILQINGNKNIIKFVDMIGPYTFLKKKQLILLKKIAIAQTQGRRRNTPYSKEEMLEILKMRDAVFEANTWTRSRIKQKYPIGRVMAENIFVDLKKWQKNRNQKGLQKMIEYQKNRHLEMQKKGR